MLRPKALAASCCVIGTDINPDLIILTGDRIETLAACLTATYMDIPIAHIQAGDKSGHVDDIARAAISKMSHIHFVSAEDHKKRVNQLGETPKSIHVVGGMGVDTIKKTNYQNLDIITSNVDLSGLEVETAGNNERAFILKSKLTAYLNNSGAFYDYVFIDCPPSLSLLTVMALVTSDSLIVPLQTEFFALEGLTQLVKTIERIKTNLNPSLTIRGILLTMYDRRNKLSSQVEKEARDYFKEKVYQTVIPRNVRLSEAPSHGMPVLIYDKNCPGSKSYFNFTNEFINQESEIGSAA